MKMFRFVSSAKWSSITENCCQKFGARSLSSVDWNVDLDTGIVSFHAEPLFQTIIGMEIHAQLDIPTKLFSAASTANASPNQAVHPLDVAVPGVLPVLSADALQAAVLTAAACNCELQHISRFERKHYAYADQPLGYQMTQQRWPLARNGRLQSRKRALPGKKEQCGGEKFIAVGIDRIQLEQDTGKTTTVTRKVNDRFITKSIVDFNRAGSALIEIVFLPDIRSANDASAVLATFRNLVRHIGTCNGKMEEGSLRCDLNISIAPLGENTGIQVDPDNPFREHLPPGTGHRVEVKNLNSIKQVAQAAEYEAIRQAIAFSKGCPTKKETRTFDPSTLTTVTTRSKEGAVDYRFMPEPDLPPIALDKDTLGGHDLKGFLDTYLRELPEKATLRLMHEYGLQESVALVITSDPSAVALYEEAIKEARRTLGDHPSASRLETMTANWLCNDLFALVKRHLPMVDEEIEVTVQESLVSGIQLGELMVLIIDGTLSTTMAKKTLEVMYTEVAGKSPRIIAAERNWKVVSDLKQLKDLCIQVVYDTKHNSHLERYRKGGKDVTKMERFFIGQAMKESLGNADPELLQHALQEVLQELT